MFAGAVIDDKALRLFPILLEEEEARKRKQDGITVQDNGTADIRCLEVRLLDLLERLSVLLKEEFFLVGVDPTVRNGVQVAESNAEEPTEFLPTFPDATGQEHALAGACRPDDGHDDLGHFDKDLRQRHMASGACNLRTHPTGGIEGKPRSREARGEETPLLGFAQDRVSEERRRNGHGQYILHGGHRTAVGTTETLPLNRIHLFRILDTPPSGVFTANGIPGRSRPLLIRLIQNSRIEVDEFNRLLDTLRKPEDRPPRHNQMGFARCHHDGSTYDIAIPVGWIRSSVQVGKDKLTGRVLLQLELPPTDLRVRKHHIAGLPLSHDKRESFQLQAPFGIEANKIPVSRGPSSLSLVRAQFQLHAAFSIPCLSQPERPPPTGVKGVAYPQLHIFIEVSPNTRRKT